MKKKYNIKVQSMVISALMTALIFLFTRFLQVPIGVGYVHLGDALIYITALIVGGPWGVLCGVFAGALSDLTSGWAAFIPATVVIKILIALPFSLVRNKSQKLLTPTTILLTIPSGVITVAGYFAADMFVDKTFAVVDIAGNSIQAVGSAILFVVLAAAFDTVGLKNKINKKEI